MDFIPLVTDEQRITFLKATEPLCSDIQRVIWDMYIKTFEIELPDAPRKIKYIKVNHSLL